MDPDSISHTHIAIGSGETWRNSNWTISLCCVCVCVCVIQACAAEERAALGREKWESSRWVDKCMNVIFSSHLLTSAGLMSGLVDSRIFLWGVCVCVSACVRACNMTIYLLCVQAELEAFEKRQKDGRRRTGKSQRWRQRRGCGTDISSASWCPSASSCWPWRHSVCSWPIRRRTASERTSADSWMPTVFSFSFANFFSSFSWLA